VDGRQVNGVLHGAQVTFVDTAFVAIDPRVPLQRWQPIAS